MNGVEGCGTGVEGGIVGRGVYVGNGGAGVQVSDAVQSSETVGVLGKADEGMLPFGGSTSNGNSTRSPTIYNWSPSLKDRIVALPKTWYTRAASLPWNVFTEPTEASDGLARDQGCAA